MASRKDVFVTQLRTPEGRQQVRMRVHSRPHSPTCKPCRCRSTAARKVGLNMPVEQLDKDIAVDVQRSDRGRQARVPATLVALAGVLCALGRVGGWRGEFESNLTLDSNLTQFDSI